MSDAFPITVYHNPECGTSRNTLAMIEAAGYQPEVVEYRTTGWTRPLLEKLLADMEMTPGQILREKGTRAAEMGLTTPSVAAETLIKAMLEDPLLVNRPIVVTPKGTRLCRPSELVLEMLDRAPARFVKEDGEVVASLDTGTRA